MNCFTQLVAFQKKANQWFMRAGARHDGRSPAVIPGKGRNGLEVPGVVIARGCAPHPISPLRGHPREQTKNKKVRTPPARISPNGPGGAQPDETRLDSAPPATDLHRPLT